MPWQIMKRLFRHVVGQQQAVVVVVVVDRVIIITAWKGRPRVHNDCFVPFDMLAHAL